MRPEAVEEQRYLGILCGSSTTSFRVPEDKLQKLHALIQAVLEQGSLTVQMLEKIADKRVSTSVAIRPASLWTHHMFAAIAKANGREIHLSNKPDLCAEINIWRSLSATAQESPRYKPRHYASRVTVAAPTRRPTSGAEWCQCQEVNSPRAGGSLTSSCLGTLTKKRCLRCSKMY